MADRLDQFDPVDLADQAQGGDDVADCQVGGHLGRLALQHQRRAVRAVAFNPLDQDRRGVELLGWNALPQLGEPGSPQPATRHLRVHPVQMLFADSLGRVADSVRQLPCHLAGRDVIGHPAQVLQQHHPQRRGQGPQLGQPQFADFLVSIEERGKGLRVQHAVGVGHIGPCDAVDARQARQRSAGQLGQLGVVAARHAFPDLLELSLDQVEVVEQPFSGWRDVMAEAGAQRNLVIGPAQGMKVFLDPREKRSFPPDAAFVQHLGPCQTAAVVFEPVNAEQFGADRRLGLAGRL